VHPLSTYCLHSLSRYGTPLIVCKAWKHSIRPLLSPPVVVVVVVIVPVSVLVSVSPPVASASFPFKVKAEVETELEAVEAVEVELEVEVALISVRSSLMRHSIYLHYRCRKIER